MRLQVVLVTANPPAAAAGVRLGDKITSVDGVEAAQLSGWGLRRTFRKPAGTAVRLDLERDGRARFATWTLRDLLP